MRLLTRAMLSIGLLGVLAACHADATAHRPALDRALDPDQSQARRQSAIDQVEPSEVFELMALVTGSRHPMAVRAAAVDRMLTLDADRFWLQAARDASQVDDWPVIRLLCTRAAARGGASAVPWLIGSWSAPSLRVADADRPERLAIESLTGRPATDVLFQVVLDSASNDLATRLSGWTVLVRTVPGDVIRQALRENSAAVKGDPLLEPLRACAEAIDHLPADREAVLRLWTLRAQPNAEQAFEQARRWRDHQIGIQQSPGLALRHLPALAHRDAARDDWSAAQWIAHLNQRLQGRRHVTRGTGADEQVVATRSERLQDYSEQLGVADLIVLEAMLDAIDRPGVVQALFDQAQADQVDRTSEHGGVLRWDEQGSAYAQAFDPVIRQHDQIFYSSDACVRAMHVGLAHYHFHAQRYDNAPWAGPGKGDLGFADKLHANGIVLTYIDRDTLNADAYFPGSVVIDLGCVTRP